MLRDFDANQRWLSTQAPSSSVSMNERSPAAMLRARSGIVCLQFLLLLGQLEPVEPARRKRQPVRKLPDAREARTSEQLYRIAALERGQVELHGLRRARDI